MIVSSYPCGPLQVRIGSDPHALESHLRGALDLYSAPWEGVEAELELHLTPAGEELPPPQSDYLETARMQVWTTPSGLAARCDSGATAQLHDRAEGRWTIGVPPGNLDIWSITDLENLMSLVLTTGWRALGWVPFHAGLVCRPGGPAALLCAPSGGSKTTLTLALIRRGWSTLGDDKLLLRHSPDEDNLEARALVHTFNLYPRTRQWFPELGDLSQLPKYSVWTDKRRVPVAHLHPDAPLTHARPSHLIQVLRSDAHHRVEVAPLDRNEVLSMLLRQTVIPSHHQTACFILDTVAELAGRLTGLRVEVGRDAYLQPGCLAELEAALERSG